MYDETAERIKAFNEGFVAGAKEEHRKFIDAMRVMTAKIKELEDKHWEECRQIALYDDEVKNIRNSIFDEIIERCKGCASRGFENCKSYDCIMHHCLACVDGDRWLATMKNNAGYNKWCKENGF